MHIDSEPAEVDEYYIPDVEAVGDIGASLEAIGAHARPSAHFPANLWQAIMNELSAHADDRGDHMRKADGGRQQASSGAAGERSLNDLRPWPQPQAFIDKTA